MQEAFILGILGVVAVGRLPVLRINRAGMAVLGAVGLLVTGAVTMSQAFSFIDGNTLVLLFAMMIVTAYLRLAGLFRLTAGLLGKLAHTPRTLLFSVMGISAVLSAFFINDTVCLMLTPLLLDLTLALSLNPIPFLMGLALSSNIGSMTTLIGNPQNILIGSASGLSFTGFSSVLIVPGILCLMVTFLILAMVYHKDLRARTWSNLSLGPQKIFKPLVIKSMIAFLLMVLGVSLGLGLTVSVLGGVGLLLITRRVKPEKVFKEVDWSLLVFFCGLFILTGALEKTLGFKALFAAVTPHLTNSLGWLSGASALLSNLISNVPAVMVLSPFIPSFHDTSTAWVLLAASSTLAGNLTLLGSVANLIVAESAARKNVHLGFCEYLKTGLISASVSIVLTTLWFILMLKN